MSADGGVGYTWGSRDREGRHSRAGGSEQRIHVSVVTAGELDDLVAASHAPGQAQHRHGGFGPRVDQADLLDGHPLDDLGCKINFGQAWGRRRRFRAGPRWRPRR